MKKTLSVFLVLLLLLSVAPLAAMGDVLPKLDLDLAVTARATGDTPYLTSGFCGDTSDGGDGTNIAWSLDADGTLTLTGTGKMGSTPNREDNRVKKLIVGEGITTITEYAFSFCQKLTEVTLPSTMVGVGAYAFERADKLVTADLGGCTEIGPHAFYGCFKLVTVHCPFCETIAEQAFAYDVVLQNVDLSNVKRIGERAFYSAKMKTVTLSSCIEIGKSAFDYCNSIEELSFSEELTEIGESAFSRATAAQGASAGVSLTFPDSVQRIGYSAFSDCAAIVSVTFGTGLTSIGQYAFRGCNPAHIVIPDACTFVGRDAFSGDAVETLHLGAAVTRFDGCTDLPGLESITVSAANAAFASYDGVLYDKEFTNVVQLTKNTTLNLPAQFRSRYGDNFLCQWTTIAYVNADENNPYYQSVDGILYTKDGDTLLLCPRAYEGSVTVPEGTLRIGTWAFSQCDALTGLTLPQSLTTIESVAFHQCSLPSVEIPSGVTEIPSSAFSSSKLTTVVFHEGLTRIDWGAFSFCDELTGVSFPDSLETIGESAFFHCYKFTTVRFGTGLQSVGKTAFSDCPLLTGDIVFPDTCETVGENAFDKTAITSLRLGKRMEHFGISVSMNALESITVAEENEKYASYDGVLYSKDFSSFILSPAKEILNLPPQLTLQDGNFLRTYPNFTAYHIDDANTCYRTIDGVLYSKDGKTLIACPRGYTGTLSVADGTETIAAYGICGCQTLDTILLPDTVVTLEPYSLSSCGLTGSFVVPDSVTSIGRNAFSDTRFSTVTFGKGLPVVSCYELPLYGSRMNVPGRLTNVYLSEGTQRFLFYDFNTTYYIMHFYAPNRYMECERYGTVYPASSDAVVRGYCGSPAHEMAVKRLFRFDSLGHTWLDWYVYEPATFDHDGLEKRDCAYCGESETRVIPKLEPDIYTATFVADGHVVASVDFQKGTTSIDEPAVPARDRYTGAWEPYTLNDEDLTINAVYTLIKSDDAEEIETESTIEHYTEKDNILFRVKATSAARIVKSIVSQSIPLDIVLVVDQSGSMDDVLGGSVKKVDALKDSANSFIASVAENARLTGAAHRIGIVGFGLAGSYSGYQTNENSELLTGTNGVVNYSDVTPADYASALLPVLNGNETNAALTQAVAAIEARGSTAADLGLEMAKGVFANTDSTGRDRVVIFMTDGEPTYTNGFQDQVANSAVYNAGLLKNAYDALVYSVGIFGNGEGENRKIKSFMNAVSSNYPNAKTYMNLGTAASDVFSITASHTDALNDVFRTITTESLSHTAPFDNVTLIKTLSPYVTLTAPQEETLRIDVIRQYGVSNDQITVTRDEQGRTQIRIDGLTPYEVTDGEGNVSYEVAIEFFASLNENVAAAGTYAVDTDDSGIMLGGDAVGYEAAFDTNELTLSAQKTRYIFTINGEVYEIAEGSTVAAAVPETDFAADWTFSGWNTAGVSNANGTIIDATLVKAPRTVIWHTADSDVQQIYTEGQFLTPPEVGDRADGSKFLSWDKSLPTVMLDQDLEFTAVYGPHIHRYTSDLTTKATCTTDGLLTYTCMCGDVYTEPVAAIGHNYEAITATGDSDPNRCTFVCTNCGDRYEYALNYKVEERSFFGSRTVYEFALTDDDLETGMQPDGSIDVRVPLNEFQGTARNVKVRRYVNGVWENVPAKIEDGFLVITADHFTPYEVQFTFDCNETGNHSWNSGTVTKEATCKEPGEITCTCETCEGTNVVYTGLNSDNHANYGSHIENAKVATCKEEGYTGDTVCDGCGATLQTGASIGKDKNNHADYGSHIENAKAATCNENGYTGDTVCDGCGATLQAGTVISKATVQHSFTHIDAKAATTEAEGNVEYYHCSICGKNFSDANGTTELAKVSIDKLIPQKDPNACKYCGEVHKGPFGWLIKIIHSILAIFKK